MAALEDKLKSVILKSVLRELRKEEFYKSHAHKIYQILVKHINETEEVIQFIQHLAQGVGELNLSKKQQKYINANMEALPDIHAFVTGMAEELIQSTEWIANESIPFCYRPTIMKINANLQVFYDETFQARDKRKQIDSRPIRRMDSLARLLSLAPGKSVCSACAIHNGSVIVAANVSKQGLQQQVAEALFYRLKIISRFINEMKNAESYLDIEMAAEDVIDDLLFENSSTLPKDILQTALAKLTYSVCCDDGAFSKEERAVFLQKEFLIQIILPSFENKQSRFLLYNSGCDDIVNIALPGKSCCASVRNIHAEQILAKHILSDKNHGYTDEAMLKIGISKLCCFDCFVNLQKLPVQTRGCHGLRYEGTFQIFETNEVLSLKTPPRQAPTCAVRSDPRSPTRSILGEGSLFAASSSVKRKLDFEEEATPIAGHLG